MGRARKSIVQKLLRAADSPIFELPKAWHALSRYRTAELFLKHPAPPVVKYNDAGLYRGLVKAYPEVKLEPLRINSAQPSLAARIIEEHQQLSRQEQQKQQQQQEQQQQVEQPSQQQSQLDPQLQQQPRKQQQWRMSEKLAQALARAGEAGGTGYLDFIQQQEEEALQAALQKLRQQEAAAAAEGKKLRD